MQLKVSFNNLFLAVGLAEIGEGGKYIEEKYNLINEIISKGGNPQDVFPINTHGGLLAFGAPWEVPAMFNIIEAVVQLNGTANQRQIKGASRALGIYLF